MRDWPPAEFNDLCGTCGHKRNIHQREKSGDPWGACTHRIDCIGSGADGELDGCPKFWSADVPPTTPMMPPPAEADRLIDFRRQAHRMFQK